VTLSAGLALWPAQGCALDELLHAADVALYEAKRAGRNRVQLCTQV
jgi:GGDEF domain-containing protein